MFLLNKYLISSLLILILFASCKDNVAGNEEDSTKMELVWSDEFDYTGSPDSTKWDYDMGASGWGNNELQYYSDLPINVRVEGGVMVIEARRHEGQSPEYSSARIVTRGKASWTYGRFEIRAKLPYGRGTWPAIWMLPLQWNYGNGGWPDNGEIDIMEHVGYDPGVIHASTHCHSYNWPNNTQKTATVNVQNVDSDFHTYTLEWDSEKMVAFVDSTKYFISANDGSGWEGWPFNKSFYLILNIAIGGSWGGAQGVDNSIFPQQMIIDYVRVYQKK